MRLSEAEGRVTTATAAAEEVREALALRSREPQVVEAPTRASTAARVAEAHAHARASAAEARAALAEKMLVYALGRGLTFYDRCAIDKIVDSVVEQDYRFSVLVTEIVKSEPFRMVRNDRDHDAN